MYKEKKREIEEVVGTLERNSTLFYIIKFSGMNLPMSVEENKLTEHEKKICEKSLLNQKRKSQENTHSENSKSANKNKKRSNKKDNSSFNSSSLFNKKTKKKKNKKEQNLEKENKYKYKYNKHNNNNNDSEIDNNSQRDNNDSIDNNERDNNSESNSKSEEPKTNKYERTGVLLEDTPIKILNVGYKNRYDKNLYCLVKWKQSGKVRILDSIVENKKIKQICPQLLIEFYESRIIFLDNI